LLGEPYVNGDAREAGATAEFAVSRKEEKDAGLMVITRVNPCS